MENHILNINLENLFLFLDLKLLTLLLLKVLLHIYYISTVILI